MSQNQVNVEFSLDTLAKLLQNVRDVEKQITSLVQTPARKSFSDPTSSAILAKLSSELQTASLTLSEKLGLLQSLVLSSLHSQTSSTLEKSGETTAKKNDCWASALQEYWTEGFPRMK